MASITRIPTDTAETRSPEPPAKVTAGPESTLTTPRAARVPAVTAAALPPGPHALSRKPGAPRNSAAPARSAIRVPFKSDTCLPVFSVAGRSDLISVKPHRVHLSQERDRPRGTGGPEEEEEECLEQGRL